MSQPPISPNWPTTPAEERDWQTVREQYMLDPDEIYLNTGSFGSLPRPVFDCLVEGLRKTEQNPTVNRGLLYSEKNSARSRLGEFLNVPSAILRTVFEIWALQVS